MKTLYISAVALLLGLSLGTTTLAAMPDVNGVWKPMSADDRLMTIKLLNGKITIEARDLSCSLTELQPQANDSSIPSSVTANSVCDDESDTIYTKETLTTFRVGRDIFLIDSTILLRHVNENSDPKVDETYTNQPPIVTIYRRIRSQ